MLTHPSALLALFLIGLLPSLPAEEMTVSFASATPGYLARRGSSSAPENYIFVQGQFYGGRIVDKGLQKMSFRDLARTLAGYLRQKSYVPSKNIDTADLMLVVHWGVTIGNDRDQEMMLRDLERSRDLVVQHGAMSAIEMSPPPLPEGEVYSTPTNSSMAIKSQLDFELLNARTGELGEAVRGKSTSAMLGFTKDLQQDAKSVMASEKTKTLMAMMEEDRYFIVIIAYDMEKIRTEKKIVRLWATRMSIRSAGVNFASAVQRMGTAGAQIFGTSQTEVNFTKHTRKVREEITIGEPIILGTEDETPSSPATP